MLQIDAHACSSGLDLSFGVGHALHFTHRVRLRLILVPI